MTGWSGNRGGGGTGGDGHTHSNKSTLDKFGESGGLPTFNGSPIGGGNGGPTPIPSANIQNFYSGSKAGKKICIVGDSTSDYASAPAFQDRLTQIYGQVGSPLNGISVINYAVSGDSLYNLVNNIGNTKGLLPLITAQADLYLICYGINDIRSGANSPARTREQVRNDLNTVVDTLLDNTSGYILLRTPNIMLRKNTNNWIDDIEKSQEYTDQLWEIYQSFSDYSPRVDVVDIQSPVFGRTSPDAHYFMTDSLHPNVRGYKFIADVVAERICNTQFDMNLYPDYQFIMRGVVDDVIAGITNSTLVFHTASTGLVQVGDVVCLGKRYSFVVKNTPTKTGNVWTIPHYHNGDVSQYGCVKVIRKI